MREVNFVPEFLTWLLFIICTIAIGVKEGWYDRWKNIPDPKKRKLSAFIWHVYSALIYGAGLVLIIIFHKYVKVDLEWWQIIGSILLIRYASFDWSRNASQGLPIEWVGSTDWYSLIIKKIPEGIRASSRLLSLFLGYGILILGK